MHELNVRQTASEAISRTNTGPSAIQLSPLLTTEDFIPHMVDESAATAFMKHGSGTVSTLGRSAKPPEGVEPSPRSYQDRMLLQHLGGVFRKFSTNK